MSKESIPSRPFRDLLVHHEVPAPGLPSGLMPVGRKDLNGEDEDGHEAGGHCERGPEGLEREERGREADRGWGNAQAQPQEPDGGRGPARKQPHPCQGVQEPPPDEARLVTIEEGHLGGHGVTAPQSSSLVNYSFSLVTL